MDSHLKKTNSYSYFATLLKWHKQSEHLPNLRKGHAVYSFLVNISMPHRRKKCPWYIIQYIYLAVANLTLPHKFPLSFACSQISHICQVFEGSTYFQMSTYSITMVVHVIIISFSYNRSYVVASSSTVVRWQPRGERTIGWESIRWGNGD